MISNAIIPFSYVPFNHSAYQLNDSLSTEEKEALKTSHRRSRALTRQTALASLLPPLLDIARNSGTGRSLTRVFMLAMLAETHRTGLLCWKWTEERWIAFCRDYHSGLLLISAFAWHLGSLREQLNLPALKAPALYAHTIFGQALFHQELHRLTEVLIALGYAPASQKAHISGILATLMLVNEDPRMETFTPELLWRIQSSMDARASRYVGRVSHGLAALGIIHTPLRMRNYTKWYEKPVEGIDPAWVHWCRRWRDTSVLRPKSRENQYSFILRCGLWLARTHPAVREPTDWTMEICASFIAAVGRMNVDELQLGTEKGVRKSVRSGEPMMPHSRAGMIYAVRRFMIDFENWGWGRLHSAPHAIFRHPIPRCSGAASIHGLSTIRSG